MKKKILMKYGFELEVKVPHEYFDNACIRMSGLGTITGDSSIQATPNQRAFEIRSAVGGKGYVLALADRLSEILKESRATVNSSCGYHLHVSNHSFYVKRNINRIVFLWCAIEDVLFSTQPESRYNNQYCRRKLSDFLDDTDDMPTAKRELISYLAGRGRETRYFALNLYALRDHGTIEVRLHAGTVSGEKIKAWIELMSAFFNYAITSYNHEEVLNLFNTNISDEKINRVFDLLKVTPRIRKHFMERIGRFGFEKLGKEQEVAKDFLKLLPSYKRKRQLFLKVRNMLSEEENKIDHIRMNFNSIQRVRRTMSEEAQDHFNNVYYTPTTNMPVIDRPTARPILEDSTF